jgi:imidazoleglycerol-phosphate dehydratase
VRTAEITRNTTETQISLRLDLDGGGKYNIDSGIGFLNHMLELFARHGRFDLELSCKGDTDVDFHHSVEDVGICLGKAFAEALGGMRGITRYGSCILPMDEALMLAAVDLSGRAYLGFDAEIPAQKVGDFDTELVKEFLLAFSGNIRAAVHIKKIAGENSHHIIEAIFKALARALARAVSIDGKHADEIPSTKGLLL